MLNFIFGASGSGKTYYVIKSLEDMSHSADTPLFLIVPEQSSHTTEKKLLQDLGEQFSRKINVVTFKRMSDLVMQKTGGIAGRRVSDGEKNILMSRAISLCADELGAYKSKAMYPELVSLMLKTAERLKLCMVSSQMLFDASEEINDDMLKSKINDVALIFEKYNSLLNESYSDPSDDLEKLSIKLSQNDFFKIEVSFLHSPCFPLLHPLFLRYPLLLSHIHRPSYPFLYIFLQLFGCIKPSKEPLCIIDNTPPFDILLFVLNREIESKGRKLADKFSFYY